MGKPEIYGRGYKNTGIPGRFAQNKVSYADG
jgi:hypothetical protein